MSERTERMKPAIAARRAAIDAESVNRDAESTEREAEREAARVERDEMGGAIEALRLKFSHHD